MITPTPAHGYSTWTAQDDQGYRIPAGTQLVLARTGDDLVAFQVLAGVEIPRGQTTVEDVEISAVDEGVAGNGLSGAGEIVDPLAWVESIRRRPADHPRARRPDRRSSTSTS